MPFPGRQYNGSIYNFETEAGDGTSAPARPIQRIKYDDILPAIVSVNASTQIVEALAGKSVEVVSIICTADATMKLRMESWDGTTGTPISPSFDVTAAKDFRHSGELGSAIAKSSSGQGIRLALVLGTGNFTGWIQYRMI
jgi:hypothetical protein